LRYSETDMTGGTPFDARIEKVLNRLASRPGTEANGQQRSRYCKTNRTTSPHLRLILLCHPAAVTPHVGYDGDSVRDPYGFTLRRKQSAAESWSPGYRVTVTGMDYYRRVKIAGEDVIEDPLQESDIMADSFNVRDAETKGSYLGGEALDMNIDEPIGEAGQPLPQYRESKRPEPNALAFSLRDYKFATEAAGASQAARHE